MIPEALCLADYGLGTGAHARERHPVASRLGGRFYDWQLVQEVEDWWRECDLHSKNLQGDRDHVLAVGEALSGADGDRESGQQIELFDVG